MSARELISYATPDLEEDGFTLQLRDPKSLHPVSSITDISARLNMVSQFHLNFLRHYLKTASIIGEQVRHPRFSQDEESLRAREAMVEIIEEWRPFASVLFNLLWRYEKNYQERSESEEERVRRNKALRSRALSHREISYYDNVIQYGRLNKILRNSMGLKYIENYMYAELSQVYQRGEELARLFNYLRQRHVMYDTTALKIRYPQLADKPSFPLPSALQIPVTVFASSLVANTSEERS